MSGHEVEELPGRRGGDGDAAYSDAMLLHREAEVSFDDTVNWKVLLAVWLRAAAVASAVLLLFGFVGLIALAGDPGSGLGIMGVGMQIAMIAFVAVFLASRTAEPVGEWRILLADRGRHAESAYAEIARAARERRLPVVPVFRRIRTGGEHPRVTHRMVLRDGSYVAYLSVFAYGTGLYVGWVMRRDRRGTELVGQFVSDFVRGFGGTDTEKAVMRTEPPRAMREALHAAALEGVRVAVDGRTVAPGAAFPHGLPRTEEDVAAPVPVQEPTPMAPPPLPRRRPWAEGGS
ncbi:hypothetical protein [Streptomyces sp. NBC_01013]|uniref:hypothetical protein n=1 Tax=Streptomyces sp. NBC_01013 TaxID=2903718 RepID=UPI00386AEABE|nr:hypothetical protein OG538_19275 [Streptomyces sp. NBC_01013]